MAGAISVEGNAMRNLSKDMRAVPEKLSRHVYPVVAKGAVNIKEEMRAEMAASRSFGALSKSITYDITTGSFGGVGVIQAEIGPTKRKGGSRGGKNSLDFGANIAYFGSSKGGGGVKDPKAALDSETPKFEKALYDLTADLL